MITPYVQAAGGALGGVLNLLTRLALPLSLLLGLAVVAGVCALVFGRDHAALQRIDWPRVIGRSGGYAAVGLLAVVGWAALGAALPLAREAIVWRESAEATANPVPDASPVLQLGPAVGSIAERTYTRTLTLPPEFFQRVGTEGVGVLAPYLSDPSAENVLRLSDNFRRSGADVIFTREVTRLDEEPVPFEDSHVNVKFQRLAGRAYDAEFEGRYVFKNSADKPSTTRFLFSLPEAGTVRDLNVTIGAQAVPEPNESGAYEWKGELKPGEQREAVVRYRMIGANTWSYDLGSRRRRVRQFRLDVAPDGPVRFLRGSLQPTVNADKALNWQMGSVVTAQQIALAFPPDIVGRESYLQALSSLPVTFVLFLVGLAAAGLALRQSPDPGRMAVALLLFLIGLGTITVLASYVGPVAAVLLGPVPAVALIGRYLGRGALLAAVPAALVPGTLLSAQHTGLLMLLLATITLAVAARLYRMPTAGDYAR
jgi:hypothetical protein